MAPAELQKKQNKKNSPHRREIREMTDWLGFLCDILDSTTSIKDVKV